jgi:hypothetical protein
MTQTRSTYASEGITASEFSDAVYEDVSEFRFRGIPTGLRYRRTYKTEEPV